MSHILEIKDLQVQYHTEDGTVYALNHVDLELDDGETLGLVGETGAGKTTLAKSIMRLIPDPPGKICLLYTSLRQSCRIVGQGRENGCGIREYPK